jgi:hypothetical protein
MIGSWNHARSFNNIKVVHHNQPHPSDKTSGSTLDMTNSLVSVEHVVAVEEELHICNAKKDRSLWQKDHKRRAGTTSTSRNSNKNFNGADTVIVALNNNNGTLNLASCMTRKPSNHGRSKSQRQHFVNKETSTSYTSCTSKGGRGKDDKMVASWRHRSRSHRGRQTMPAATGETNRD